MGMFNCITVTYPLSVPAWNAIVYQTKDIEPLRLDYYEIRADETLWYEWNDLLWPSADAPLVTYWVPHIFTGAITFYSNLGEGSEAGWIEFFSYFVDGKLTHLHLMKYRQGPEV